MRGRRFLRIAVVASLTTVVVALTQPAFALSSAPDQTWRTNGKVFSLAQRNNTLFVGGSFTRAISPGGQTEVVSNIAAFDITTGAYIPTFTASVQNTVATGKPEVNALAVSSNGAKLYIGGSFDTVNGAARQNFAAVDLATGAQLDPAVTVSPSAKVQAIVAGPSLVYFGGNFTSVNGLSRLHLAAISASTGALSTAWAPSTTAGTNPCPSQFPPGTNCGPTSNGGSGNVHSLALAPGGNGLFVGGNYFYVNGTPRNTIAQVSTVNGSLINWRVPWSSIPGESPSDPYQGPNVVWSILPTSTRVYVAYGRTPNGIVAFSASANATTGYVTQLWTRGAPGNPESLALSPDGSRLFVGGHFGTATLDYRITSCGSNVWAHGLISLNPSTGAFFCDWFPQMVPFGGQSAPGSGVNPPNFIGGFAMQMTSNALIVGGYFTSISGVNQAGFARFTLTGSPPPPPPAPSITSFTPASGPVGSSVTVAGSGFTGTTAVSFGSTPATSFTVDSSTQLRATVPSGFTRGPIKVTTPGGTAKSATNFNVTSSSPLAITSFSPSLGPVGTTVTINGTAFTGATAVSFGATAATSFTVVSDTQITTQVPAGAGTSPIKVTTSAGTAKSASNFKVTVLNVKSVTPNTGPVGTQVVIAGSGFTGTTLVRFNGVNATFTVDSDSQITATVPAGATSGFVSVTTPNGTAQSGSAFTVT